MPRLSASPRPVCTIPLHRIYYYDPALEFGSDDPADPAKTTRVLTIMFASEY